MDKLSKDELFVIAMELDLPAILKLCSSNKKINDRLCLRDTIWVQKLKEFPDYQEHLEDFKNMNKREIYTLLYQLKSLKEKLVSPYNIYEIYKHKELNLAGRQLQDIPKEVGSLSNLEKLWVGNNYIRTLPKELGDLINLKELYLSGNDIQELPKELGNLTNLKELYLGNNKIKSIPKELGNLRNLQELILSYNQIEQLPKELGKLRNLRALILYNNSIRSIPEEIKSIPYLQIGM